MRESFYSGWLEGTAAPGWPVRLGNDSHYSEFIVEGLQDRLRKFGGAHKDDVCGHRGILT